MSLKFPFLKSCLPGMKQGLATLMVLQLLVGAPVSALTAEDRNDNRGMERDADRNPDRDTRTPIKHVIIIIGENRTFDHVFGTFQPGHGEKISKNLLSQGIINQDGTPGPNFSQSAQFDSDRERDV